MPEVKKKVSKNNRSYSVLDVYQCADLSGYVTSHRVQFCERVRTILAPTEHTTAVVKGKDIRTPNVQTAVAVAGDFIFQIEPNDGLAHQNCC